MGFTFAGYLALVGRPNAGKSTLLNAMLGQKLSIVSYKAQTTRHRIAGILSDENYQIIVVDTPGFILSMRNKLEEVRVARSIAPLINVQLREFLPILSTAGDAA